MGLIAPLGVVLVALGLLGLLSVLALTQTASIVLLAVGVVLIVMDPGIRSRF